MLLRQADNFIASFCYLRIWARIFFFWQDCKKEIGLKFNLSKNPGKEFHFQCHGRIHRGGEWGERRKNNNLIFFQLKTWLNFKLIVFIALANVSHMDVRLNYMSKKFAQSFHASMRGNGSLMKFHYKIRRKKRREEKWKEFLKIIEFCLFS